MSRYEVGDVIEIKKVISPVNIGERMTPEVGERGVISKIDHLPHIPFSNLYVFITLLTGEEFILPLTGYYSARNYIRRIK